MTKRGGTLNNETLTSNNIPRRLPNGRPPLALPAPTDINGMGTGFPTSANQTGTTRIADAPPDGETGKGFFLTEEENLDGDARTNIRVEREK